MINKLADLPKFEQLLEVLRIFQLIANSTEIVLLHDTPVKNQHNKKSQDRLKVLYQFIEENYHRKIGVEEVAEMCNISKIAFCRYFMKITHLTFTEFLNHYRINQSS